MGEGAGRSDGGEPLILAGGTKPKRRTGRPSDWTKAMADRFVEVIADTCNVTLAARAIRRSITNVYKRRAKDASFRAAWDAALAMGYSRLEMMMLERALHGVEKTIVLRSGETKVMREYSDRVALTLLRMHRETALQADGGVDDDEAREACERIVARLQRLRDQDPDEAAAGHETKGAIDLVALIRWGLRGAARGRRAR